MRRLSSILLAAAVTLAIPLTGHEGGAQAQTTQPAPAAQATAMVTKVQAFYDKTTSFQSAFSQEYFVKSHNLRKESKGDVMFAKPGKMDWQYATPAGNRVVSDGSLLKVYEAANKQMFEQPVNASQYPAALSFLVGGGKLDTIFDFQMYAGASMNFPGGDVLVGTPKVATPAYTKVLFYVDSASSQVRRVLIVDGQGNRNRFDFENPKVNVAVSPTQFQFTPPPGTQIIRP